MSKLRCMLALSLCFQLSCASTQEVPQTGPVWEDPDADPYNFYRAVAQTLLRTRQYRQAVETVRRMEKMREDEAEPKYLLARAYLGLGQLEQAAQQLQAAIEVEESFAPAHAELGMLMDLTGEHTLADKSHRRSIALDPQSAAYRNNLGFCLYSQRRYRDAVREYLAALDLDPTHHRVHNNLGFAYGKLDELDAAYRHFLLAGPKAQASNNLGFVHESAGRLERAYDLYVIAREQDPQLIPAHRNLERVCLALGRPVPGEAPVATTPAAAPSLAATTPQAAAAAPGDKP